MATDSERHRRILENLHGFCANQSQADAYACISPSNVLLLTGYWPVLGNSLALFSSTGETTVIVPEDEVQIAQATTSARVVSYKPSSMDRQTDSVRELSAALSSVMQQLGLTRATVAYETRYSMRPATYVSSASFGEDLRWLLQTAAPNANLRSSDSTFAELGARKTNVELKLMRQACSIAAHAFDNGPAFIRPGATEAEVASAFQSAFDTCSLAASLQRSYGTFFCMSGPNSATASAAYARTRHRRLEPGDLVMIHANTCADGYWTDITRTYIAGDPTPRQTAMRTAINEARAAALSAIRPGITGNQVDGAARVVMAHHGFEEAFRHGTGHGVGFAAIYGGALPRIHPAYQDLLEEGSTFNVEPAAYFDGYGGMRHCDVVAVTANGAEVLTDF